MRAELIIHNPNFTRMKIKNVIIPTLVALFIGSLVSSCDPKPVEVTGEALFSYVTNGLEVTFTNESDSYNFV